MTPLQAAQLILGDTSLIPMKEWKGLNGELGVYHSQAHGYYYLFILIPSQNEHYTQSYPATDRDEAIHAAEFIAAFAGAQEHLPSSNHTCLTLPSHLEHHSVAQRSSRKETLSPTT